MAEMFWVEEEGEEDEACADYKQRQAEH